MFYGLYCCVLAGALRNKVNYLVICDASLFKGVHRIAKNLKGDWVSLLPSHKSLNLTSSGRKFNEVD